MTDRALNTIAAWLSGANHAPAGWRRHKLLRETMTPAIVEALREADDPSLIEAADRLWTHPYFSFVPRPDDPQEGDEQAGFVDSDSLISVCVGGNGCLAAEQPIWDQGERRYRPVGGISGRWRVLTRNPDSGALEDLEIDAPWVKGVAPLYRWTFSDGSELLATDEHRVVAKDGRWVSLLDAWEGRRAIASACEPSPGSRRQPRRSALGMPPVAASKSPIQDGCEPLDAASPRCRDSSIWALVRSVRAADGARFLRKPSGFPVGYQVCRRSYGERLRGRQAVGQSPPPSRDDGGGRSRPSLRLGGRGVGREGSRFCRSSFRLATIRCGFLSRRSAWSPTCFAWRLSAPTSRSVDRASRRPRSSRTSIPAPRGGRRFPAWSIRRVHTTPASSDPARELSFAASHPLSFPASENGVLIVGREYIRTDAYYDITAGRWANYVSGGLTHANSGKTYSGAMKCAQFLERTAPIMRDLPFWIITNTYEMAGTIWKQKLANILPSEWIDWDRITWHDVRRGWPSSVPLLPRAGSPHNWALEFKSYEQGRDKMQAAAIGGAWFSEQFPWDVFEEVLRGARECAFPGSIFMEFTPIDPAKSVEIEQQYTKWVSGDPDAASWRFCHLNTESAKNSGHVSAAWYDTFFATVSDEMAATRKRGAFASYEGQIYKSFNPLIHLLDEFTIPTKSAAGYHKRSVDWGFGDENAFCVLWGYRDTLGVWWIYDEYYSTAPVLLAERAREIRERHRWDEANPALYRQTYADPAQPGCIREFTAAGIPCSAAVNAVYEGIESVQSALKIHPELGPRLYVNRRACPNLARQLKTYRWERSSGLGYNPKDARPVPLKKDDHAVDALRYLIHTDRVRSGGGIEAGRISAPERRATRGTIPMRTRRRA